MLLAAAVYTAQRAYATAFLFSLSQRLEAKLCKPIAAFQWYQLDESIIHIKESIRATQSQHTAALGFGGIETLAASEPAASSPAVAPHEAAASQGMAPILPLKRGRPKGQNENVCLRIVQSEVQLGVLVICNFGCAGKSQFGDF